MLLCIDVCYQTLQAKSLVFLVNSKVLDLFVAVSLLAIVILNQHGLQKCYQMFLCDGVLPDICKQNPLGKGNDIPHVQLIPDIPNLDCIGPIFIPNPIFCKQYLINSTLQKPW